ncbi:GNAT family N-acetyltransferase [Pseudozobellia thermophila]|uniref:Phosphinothricin acetyltransferase n=1 Tax=Pseudozobellia thermophila TaxID=192903 RepID=A0A1M6CR35_9FLAO|nr:GNAT family N-acetyltransferase [Pseudozobellia thermophila]SHI63419.1 phosphinothricin acetyltransferase [Pseudozobellia thermophila]
MQIREMTEKDWPGVAKIYEEGIRTGFATFETEIPGYESWSAAHLPSCRLVAEDNGVLLGWTALSPVSGRCVYGGVAEVSVYVASAARNRGVGKALMHALIEASEKEGIWSLQSGIFPENRGSIELHKKMGFRFIGKRERIGRLHGVWKDNLLFERRSTVVGNE